MLKQEDDWTLVEEYADQVILLNKTVLVAGAAKDVFASDAFRAAFPHSHEGVRA